MKFPQTSLLLGLLHNNEHARVIYFSKLDLKNIYYFSNPDN